MKKILVIALALASVMALAAPALAYNEDYPTCGYRYCDVEEEHSHRGREHSRNDDYEYDQSYSRNRSGRSRRGGCCR